MNLSLIWVLVQFFVCAAAVSVAGYRLAVEGERIGQAWGLTGSWVGLAMLASVTSLPELLTGVSAVTLAHSPNIALGDALGSCVINLGFLVVVDFVLRDEPLYRKTSASHLLSGAFGVVMLGFVAMNILLAGTPGFSHPAVDGVGLYSPVIVLLYLVALRLVFQHERRRPSSPAEAAQPHEGAARQSSVWQSLGRFMLSALVVAAAGVWLPVAGAQLADALQWNRSFIGTLFIALTTSLPELAVTLSAIKLRALDMAVGNLLGSNLFNVVIIAIDDVAYRQGVLLAHVSPLHAVTALSAVVMTGLAMIGLFYRPQSRVLRTVGWVSIALAAVYLFNTYTVFLYGA
ncbi:MAG: sodium:calcium antiporter [Thiomonas sp.]|uniref:sodium:calcium antiporter n=1 Tax=Thiomonas sp. TaxID=2047785 RepID=UPI002A370854|nr:sodium:calcium antiporter [Thiomonas sp.]MDY0331548.1 sodium:calcium antiporter [Thiomonas sp.]